ncbi:hypothetical protein [Haloferula sp.]|uniref:hypothetical protein n=1 Tax=Haloferula sp. TaxID=2497595 RepID=UPI00329FE5F4
MEKVKFGLRPANRDNIEWLDPFYERIMRPFVELTHEWNPTLFREKFDPSNSPIIQLEGRNAWWF